MGGSQLFALPCFAGFGPVSDRYVQHLNSALTEQGAGFTVSAPAAGVTTGSSHDSFVMVNLPDSAQEAGSGFFNLRPVEDKLIAAQRRVEEMRRAASLASAQTVAVAANPTLDHMSHLNAAEKAWLKAVSGPLAKIANDLYAAQTDLRSEDYHRYMQRGTDLPAPTQDQIADKASRWNFARTRSPIQPSLSGNDQEYNTSIPWFPQGPSFNALLPEDFTKAEVDFITSTYPPEHPIRYPYTVVERIDANAVSERPIVSEDGIEQEWHVRGLDDCWYRVTHMRFHPRYAHYFTEAAEILEQNAAISSDGSTLSRDFQSYTLDVTSALRRGDFLKLLEIDLEQPDGNLFLSFFPHESDWNDHIKNPWELVVGVRDHTITNSLRERAVYVHGKLQEWTREISTEVGAPVPPPVTKNLHDLMKMVEVVWAYRTGGFFRAFADGDVAGHDYPKWDHPQFRGMRKAVILADSEAIRMPVRLSLAEKLFGEVGTALVDVIARLENNAWHEVNHDFNRPDMLVAGGRTLGSAFGPLLWPLAEPHSDTSIGASMSALLESDLATEPQAYKSFFNFLLRTLQMANKKNFLAKLDSGTSEFGNNHALGLTVILGRLFQNGILSVEEGRLKINRDGLSEKLNNLWKDYVRIAYQGSSDNYRTFMRDSIQAIPDEAVTLITQAKPPVPRAVVNRDDVTPYEQFT